MSTFTIIGTLVMAGSFCTGHAAGAEDKTVNEVDRLVQTLCVKFPDPIESSVVVEIVRRSAEFVQLRQVCRTEWESLLADLDAAAAGDADKFMLISAFEEELDADDYMTVLERLTDKYGRHQISTTVMTQSVFSPLGRMQAFYVDNYKHPRVRALLRKWKSLFADDPEIQTWGEDTLSGEEKEELDDYRKAHEGSMVIPQVLLSQMNGVYEAGAETGHESGESDEADNSKTDAGSREQAGLRRVPLNPDSVPQANGGGDRRPHPAPARLALYAGIVFCFGAFACLAWKARRGRGPGAE
jgi:hypothetical protein